MARHRTWWQGRPCFLIKKRPLLDLHAGEKKTLVRPDIDPIWQGISVGQIIVIGSCDLRWPFLVLAIRRYATLNNLTTSEDLQAIRHGTLIQATDYLATMLEKHLDKPMLALDLQLITKEEAAWPKTKRG